MLRSHLHQSSASVQDQRCDGAKAILVSLKTMEQIQLPENEIVTRAGVTLLFAIRAVSPESWQH